VRWRHFLIRIDKAEKLVLAKSLRKWDDNLLGANWKYEAR